MSITINGTTNTLTAASGLTIAGNTAVTGTLSASGLASLSGGMWAKGAGADTPNTGGAYTRYGVNGFQIWQSNTLETELWGSIYSGAWYTPIKIAATGLAVTGTLSATGQVDFSGGALRVFGALDTGQLSAGVFDWQAGTGNTRFLSYGPTGVQGGFSWTGVVGGGAGTVLATLSSTALTLGTGVNLVTVGRNLLRNGGYTTGNQGVVAGADIGAGTITNATRKYLSFAVPHYTSNTEEDVQAIIVDSNTTTSKVYLGGGNSQSNWATSVVLCAAANSTSLTGTEVVTATSTAVTLGTGVNLVMAPSYIEGSEMTAPAAPAANGFRIFAEDNGAGKTRLMVQFATGAAQQIAIEP